MVRWIFPALVLVGCVADEGEPAMLEELCGAAAPLHLVPLTADQTVRSGVQLFDGRIYYTVARKREGDGPTRYVDDVLWSIGGCGEDPRVIAEDVASTFVDERWPDVLLGCREQARDIVSLDPAGVAPPHVVFPEFHCEQTRRTPHGFVSLTTEGQLILGPFPDDPRVATVEPVFLADTSSGSMTAYQYDDVQVVDDAVFHLDGDILWRAALPGGATTIEQTDVLLFTVSPDGRYVLWQDRAIVNYDPVTPQSAVLLRDRTSGVGIGLVPQAALYHEEAPFAWLEDGLMTLRLLDGTQRVYSLPGQGLVDLPRHYMLRAVLADGRWLLQWGDAGWLVLADPDDITELTPLFADSVIVEVRDDGVFVREQPDPEVDEGPLWFVPFDGGAPRQLADRIGEHFRIDGDRLLTTVDVDQYLLGDLVLVDMRTREERRIDTRVGAESFWTDRSLGDDIVQYRVYQRERTGVWLVRPPPVR